MRYTIYALAAVASLVSAQSATSFAPAPKVTTNPIQAELHAELPEQTKNNVRGSVVAKTVEEGKGVKIEISVAGLPAEGGPFMYHIHEKPVPADGNCTGTGAHLDPFKRGEVPVCNPEQKETCQTGDLSGKYGNLTTEKSSFEYIDKYISTDPLDLSYFGNLSVVIHTSNKSRISCANFSVVNPGAFVPTASFPAHLPWATSNSTHAASGTGHSSSETSAAPTSVNSPTPTQPGPPAEQSTNAAVKMGIAGMGAFAGLMAFVL
ncbi:Cu,Zn superoxide dismutase-like protein [Aaosphaeria arxii CBS 175.79]|uniref:superoxide dismutase n=1 Tax=Aaosphaeria arxii CBS 175.79 TaxID=1450172 RepID=A0A6A5Y1S7_9PLEO|nr:Cu,Zn superoxide dismutase-like protein [Aaosphaeria arxii CBS 175.79]KAF2019017.1 Cu,Zn superoxide dismutase-like protein [Aaosphaeria arxii CBS 175.79]